MDQNFILEQDISSEQFDRKYQLLLEEYTKLKEQMNNPSEKQLDQEIQVCTKSLKEIQENPKPDPQVHAATLTAELENETKKKQEIFVKFENEHKQVQDKIDGKKQQLAAITSSNNQIATKISEAKNSKDTVTTNETQIKANIQKTNEDIAAKLSKISQEEVRFGQITKQNQNNKSLLQSEVSNLRKQLQTISEREKLLREDLESVGKQTKGQQNIDLSVVEKQLSKTEDELKKQKQKNEKNLKQLKSKNESLANVEKANKSAAQKQSHTKKEISKKQQISNKIKKEIEHHESELKKLQEERKERKSKQVEESTQLRKLENERKFLQDSIVWEQKKLRDFIEIKKTYVSNEEFEKLQKEKKETEAEVKSLQTLGLKLASINKKLNQIKDDVARREKEKAKNVNQKQNQLKQLKERNVQLNKKKSAIQQTFIQANTKLNEYKKEYPKHEEEKIRKNEQEKRAKLEQAKRKQEQAAINKVNKEAQKNSKKKKEIQAEEEDLQKYLPSIEKKSSAESFVDNPNFKYILVGGLAFLIVGVLLVMKNA